MGEDTLAAWTAELLPLGGAGNRVPSALSCWSCQVIVKQVGLRPLMALGEVELEYYRVGQKARSLAQVFELDRKRDMALGSTNHGAHKADIRIKVDGAVAAEVLSRGQTKLLVYAFKLAQAAHYRERMGQSCLFLLDDLPAELDYEHRAQVIACLNRLDCQYFMTGVDKQDFQMLVDGMAHQMFHMEHGVASAD